MASKNCKTPFCKVCFDAKKPASFYNTHFVKDKPGPDGKVICPTLLANECRYCHGLGHTLSFCPVLKAKNERQAAAITCRKQETKRASRPYLAADSEGFTPVASLTLGAVATATRTSNPKKINQSKSKGFSALADDSDEEDITTPPPPAPKPVLKDLEVAAAPVNSWAAIAAKPSVTEKPPLVVQEELPAPAPRKWQPIDLPTAPVQEKPKKVVQKARPAQLEDYLKVYGKRINNLHTQRTRDSARQMGAKGVVPPPPGPLKRSYATQSSEMRFAEAELRAADAARADEAERAAAHKAIDASINGMSWGDYMDSDNESEPDGAW